mmetsp:Transcript_24394/g.59730  ORF Transcript_24394/g.59730 Transcript_24394/m.59730 type:complete len:227 (-) Transcript_24394:801-1481(-)
MAETLLQGDMTAIANLDRIACACDALIDGSDVSPKIPSNRMACHCTRRLADSDKEVPAWIMSGNIETRLMGVATRPHSRIASPARACFQSSEESSCCTKGKATVNAIPPKCCKMLSNKDSAKRASSSSSMASSTRVAGSDAHSSTCSLTPLAMSCAQTGMAFAAIEFAKSRVIRFRLTFPTLRKLVSVSKALNWIELEYLELSKNCKQVCKKALSTAAFPPNREGH